MKHSTLRGLVAAVAVAVATLLGVAIGAPANATPATRFKVVGLVSNQAGLAPLVDPDVRNAWGLALSPTGGPLWVANNHSNTATIYLGGVDGAPVTKAGLTVTIPSEGPTGQVFNDTTGFVLPATTGGTGKALFMFATESGDIVAWNGSLGPKAAVVAHVEGATYKGLAIAHLGDKVFLLAPDFPRKHIDVFDAAFQPVPHGDRLFVDRRLPAAYGPFNVFVRPGGHTVYVAYAKVGPTGDEVAGAGLGFVDRFDEPREEPERIGSHGTLNAPWGMAIAPASFGRFAGALLVGNFGDGRISAFRGDDFGGLLRGADRQPIAIDGLWALQPGTAMTGGTGALWFSAGPNGEADGLVGEILPA
jgi:uncharacterized protein (TIGR03118 family)